MEHTLELRIKLIEDKLTNTGSYPRTAQIHGELMAEGLEFIKTLQLRLSQLQGKSDIPEVLVPVSQIRNCKDRLLHVAFHARTPKKYADMMYEITEVISILFGEINKLESNAEKATPVRICLNCSHMENMDYIHGTGICAALEGETVILDQPCICPKNVLQEVEALLAEANKTKPASTERIMHKEVQDELIYDIQCLMKEAVSDEYYLTILNSHDGAGGCTGSILSEIVEDVLECSGWKENGCYSESDVRYAIGRVLMRRIGICC